MLNIYHIEKSNYVNGHGNRFVLWLQGCDLGCQGCWNKETWSFEKNILKSIEEVFNEIQKSKNLDGVTFSGGEPFLQAGELSKLAKKIKNYTNLSLQIFTGFELHELRDQNQKELLKYTDILVAGRFDSTKKNNNQKVYILNSNVPIWDFNNSDVEIEIDDNNHIKITGYPTSYLINELKGI